MSASNPVPFVNPAVETLSLRSGVNGRNYDLRIGLPASYGHGDTRYPVLFVLDAEFAFGTACETAMLEAVWSAHPGASAGTKVVPEVIVVGVALPDTANDPFRRNYEFMPEADIDGLPQSMKDFMRKTAEGFGHGIKLGGSEHFLEVIRLEIFPIVDAQYRTDPARRVFFGTSAGGTFGCYALLTKPDTFTDYIIASPGSLGPELFKREEKVASEEGDIKARVYLTVGEAESEDPTGIFTFTTQFAEVLRQRRYPGLSLQTWFIPGATHVQTIGPSIARGLTALLGKD